MLTAKLLGMKEEKPSSPRVRPSICEVRDERAAALLLDNKTRRLLSPFVAATKSVKEASDELFMKLATYYPYVKGFERAGLIEVVEVVPRAGRAIKHYRSVADEYFIPHTVSPLMGHYEALELGMHNILFQAVLQAWSESTDEVNTWGFRFYKNPELGFSAMGARAKGEPWDLFRDEGPVILPYWRRLFLSREKARALQLELHEVLERYTAEQSGGDTYLLRIGLAPLTED